MIVFMGVAGAGKSVQGRLLADELGYPWLSTGEFFRMLISGQKRLDMVAGKLLGDKDVISLVSKVFDLVDTDHEFVLDGFPRTVHQADWLLSQIKHGQLDLTAVIHIQASEDEVRSRLLQRGRNDDTEEAIAERFKEYNETTIPIVEEFKKAGSPVIDIDGARSTQEVHDDILTAIEKTRPTNVN